MEEELNNLTAEEREKILIADWNGNRWILPAIEVTLAILAAAGLVLWAMSLQ